MRIVVSSPVFAPSVGGIETGTEVLARELTALGHEVVVVTRTPSRQPDSYAFRVVRDPGPIALLRLTRWCEIYYQHALSLRELWPLLLLPRTWAVSHHNWYCRTDGRIAWQDRLKRRILHYAQSSISVSRALAADLDAPSIVIPNPYRDDIFRLQPEVERSRDLIFAGRLVTDKGVDLLLDALSLLAQQGFRPGLTIAGDGPERTSLERQAVALGLEAQVRFLGFRSAPELAALFNAHRVLVMPSRYHEPFGMVALEGIACGCVVVATAGGGAADAVGPCGRLVPNRDVPALAAALAELLDSSAARDELLGKAADHLDAHRAGVIARRIADELAAARTRGRFPWMRSRKMTA